MALNRTHYSLRPATYNTISEREQRSFRLPRQRELEISLGAIRQAMRNAARSGHKDMWFRCFRMYQDTKKMLEDC